MQHLRAVVFVLAFASIPVAVAQPDDEDESGGTVHDSDEVIGPDGVVEPPPDDGADKPDPDADADAAPATPTGNAGYDKGFFIKSDDGKFSLKLKARVQPFLSITRNAVGEKDYLGAFEVRRGRVVLEGNLHGDDLKYKFQADFGKGNATLKDFYADARLGQGEVWLRAGQWKRPFSRQQITSSGKLELADRAITDKVFGAGRDLGLAIHNGYEDSPAIEWAVGVWNGTGDASSIKVTTDPMTGAGSGSISNVPVKFKPAFIARIGINSDGAKGYSEADLEGGPLRWSAAASFWAEADFADQDSAVDKMQLDFMVKNQGLSASGGLYAMTNEVGVHPLSDQELAYVGFHLQAGYMIKPTFQGIARFALISPRIDGLLKQQEITVGTTYYGWGHDAKVTADLRFLKNGDGKFTDGILFELGSNVGF